jgi:hypothetical protein
MGIKDLLFEGDKFSLAKAAGLATAAAGVYGALKPDSSVGEFFGGAAQRPTGYTGGIPEYKVSRALQPDAFSATTPTGEARVPGSMGRQYFTPTTFTPTGNVMSPAIRPVDTQAQETAKAQGIIDSLPEDVVMEILQSMFGTGGISTPTTPAPAPAPAPETTTGAAATPEWGQIATYLRNGALTPAQTATALNLSEADIVFGLLDSGETTPEEVAQYYGDTYTVQQITDTYNSMGGTKTFAQGGMTSVSSPRGYYLGGQTDGMADKIPATIEGKQPAKLSDGEFVVPADIVSHLGNGNSDAGAKQLYSMMDRVRQARTGRQEQGRPIAPNDYLPG